ncbi:MAG: class I SAM-dependent methyltransferase [Bacteroidia bacterium]|nr:class I SAM-dependent methyltransferase [Bacteroidia bacterium]
MFTIISPDIQTYCDTHTEPESEVLKKLNRYTCANVLQPRMISGHFQGKFLAMLSKMIKPKYILEIGTYTGYSALCLAEGLHDDGKLITIDINPEQEDIITKSIEGAGLKNKVQFIVGDAYNIIKTLPYQYDLVFIDADKQNYLKYYEQVLPLVNSGGYIICDNVLWSGKVVEPDALLKDKDTIAINQFNDFVAKDARVEKILIPIRDGIYVCRKR